MNKISVVNGNIVWVCCDCGKQVKWNKQSWYPKNACTCKSGFNK